MAGRAGSRVVVASIIRQLANQVRERLPTVTVDNIDFQRDKFPEMLASDAGLRQRLWDAEVMLCDRPVLVSCIKAGAAPKLKWAQTTSGGIEEVLKGFNYIKPVEDLVVTRTGHGFGELMAEYVLAHVLARERHLAAMRLKQQTREWDPSFIKFRQLLDLSIGILGYGAIGKEVAKYCKALGMTVWTVSRTNFAGEHVDHFRSTEHLEEVLSECDYVCNILPHTPATVGLLSGDVLKHCRNKNSVFINIGRGSIIDDESLIRAIREGWLGGAVLDVFNAEPLPRDSPLWSLPNVIITPHVSGPSLPSQVARAFADNFKLYTTDQPLNHVVDWARHY